MTLSMKDLAELMLTSKMQVIERDNIINFNVEKSDKTPEEALDAARKPKTAII